MFFRRQFVEQTIRTTDECKAADFRGGGGVPPVGQSAVPDEPVKPNRSELRVMTEDAKATENAVKNVIERFDANLSDRQARESAQNEFKAMLPDYKEKMLQIGKAKMKGESHPVETP
ncbi:hypothetical protein [Methylomonas sp. CM2]|uniref:hypothetical protein n=1 Tax=Methylomonas sp. CM2 TaxID=3417647 RepID=UPI003CF0C4F4